MTTKKKHCPACGQKISLSLRMHYLLWGTAHTIACPHCGQRLHPTQSTFGIGFSLGGATAFLSFWAYILCIEDNFWDAIAFAVGMSALLVLIISIVTVENIRFTT